MAKPKDLNKLKDHWYKILKQDGFNDIEDKRQNLKQYDRRTQSFDDRQDIMDFFLRIDHYLAVTEVSPLERKILELYTRGVYVKDIALQINRSRQTVHRIIAIYKNIVRHFPHD